MSEQRLLVIDLDGTLCEQTAGGDAYWDAKPKQEVIDKVNQLFDEGWHITIYTARGMRTCKNDVERVNSLYRKKTIDWLIKNGVWFSDLIMGKPAGDIYVDDRGMRPDEFVGRC
jgi:capsule biosynthesis phosphatase